MKKPWFLRLLGWVDVAAWALVALLAMGWFNGSKTPPVAGGLLLFGSIAVVLGAVWFVMSTLLWGMNRQTRANAAVLRDVFAAKRTGTPHSRGGADPTPAPGSIVPMCEMCKRASVLTCRTHMNRLCWTHAQTHDLDACRYTLSRRESPVTVPYGNRS